GGPADARLKRRGAAADRAAVGRARERRTEPDDADLLVAALAAGRGLIRGRAGGGVGARVPGDRGAGSGQALAAHHTVLTEAHLAQVAWEVGDVREHHGVVEPLAPALTGGGAAAARVAEDQVDGRGGHGAVRDQVNCDAV